MSTALALMLLASLVLLAAACATDAPQGGAAAAACQQLPPGRYDVQVGQRLSAEGTCTLTPAGTFAVMRLPSGMDIDAAGKVYVPSWSPGICLYSLGISSENTEATVQLQPDVDGWWAGQLSAKAKDAASECKRDTYAIRAKYREPIKD